MEDSNSSAVGEDPRLGQGRVDQRRGAWGGVYSSRRPELRAVGGSASQRERRRGQSGPTPAPRAPRLGGARRGGWAAALPRRTRRESLWWGGAAPCSPTVAVGCGRGKAGKVSHVCAFPRAGRAYVCVCVSCGQARGLLCRLHLPFKWPPSVSSLTASRKSAPPAVALRQHLCLGA